MMKGGTDTRRKLSLLEKLCICSEDTPKGCLSVLQRVSGGSGGCGDVFVSRGAAARKEL